MKESLGSLKCQAKINAKELNPDNIFSTMMLTRDALLRELSCGNNVLLNLFIQLGISSFDYIYNPEKIDENTEELTIEYTVYPHKIYRDYLERKHEPSWNAFCDVFKEKSKRDPRDYIEFMQDLINKDDREEGVDSILKIMSQMNITKDMLP